MPNGQTLRTVEKSTVFWEYEKNIRNETNYRQRVHKESQKRIDRKLSSTNRSEVINSRAVLLIRYRVEIID